MQKDFDRTNQPMLPFMPGDDRDALDLLLMIFYELGMIFKSCDILPSFAPGSVDQQSDLAILPDDRIDLRRDLGKSSAFNFSGAMIFNALAEITSAFITQILLYGLTF